MSRSITSNANINTMVNNGLLESGMHVYGPINVSAHVTRMSLAVDRLHWIDPGCTLACTLDLSLDGGQTWASDQPTRSTDPYPMTVTSCGGALRDHQGHIIPATTLCAVVPAHDAPRRALRLSVAVGGGAVRTTISMELE